MSNYFSKIPVYNSFLQIRQKTYYVMKQKKDKTKIKYLQNICFCDIIDD